MPNNKDFIDFEAQLKRFPKITSKDYNFLIRYALSKMRMPLIGIKGYLSLIVSGEIQKPDKKLMSNLLSETDRAMGQINALMDFIKKYENQKGGLKNKIVPHNKSIKILMFEDDKFLSDMYCLYFEKVGFKVICLEYPPNNLVEVITREKPDLISMSVIMPQMDGFKATKILKENDHTKNIPLVFLTNMGDAKDVKKGLSLGAKDYIVRADNQPVDVINKFKKILSINN